MIQIIELKDSPLENKKYRAITNDGVCVNIMTLDLKEVRHI